MDTSAARHFGCTAALLALALGACGEEQEVLARASGTTPDPFHDQRIDFGSVVEGESLKHTFDIRNITGGPVLVSSIVSDCSCTLSSSSLRSPTGATEPYSVHSPIPHEATLSIDAVFDTIRKRGHSEVAINVLIEGANQPLRLVLSAEVTPNIQIDPLPLDLGLLTTKQSRSGDVLITSPSAGRFRVALSEAPLPDELHALLTTVPPGQGEYSSSWKLSVTLGPDAPKFDNHFYQVQLDCQWPPDVPLEPRIVARLPETVAASIVAGVSGEVAAKPPYLSFGALDPDREVTRTVEILAPGATSLVLDVADVRLVECEGLPQDRVRLALERKNAMTFELSMTVARESVHGTTFRGTILVGSDLEVQFFGLRE